MQAIKETDQGSLKLIIRVINIVVGLLVFGIGGIYHIYRSVDVMLCDDAGVEVDVDCPFFEVFSNVIISIYLLCAIPHLPLSYVHDCSPGCDTQFPASCA
jgi:hypothetical protein